MIVLVKLCIALSRHASVTHHDIYAVRNVNLHLSSGKGALINAQTAVEAVGNTCRVRTAHLAFSCQSIQNFVLRMGAQALLKIN